MDGRICCDCGVWKPASAFYTIVQRGRERLHSYCKDCFKDRNKSNYVAHAEQQRRWMREYRSQLRMQVVEAYGSACSCCGETTVEFLTVDHVENDGAEHRRQLGASGGPRFYRTILAEGCPPKYQLLCWNCNAAKAIYGLCPHQLKAAVAAERNL